MDFKEKFIKIVHHPELIWSAFGALGILNWISDERYLKINYRLQMKKKLNLENPQTFNEKLQWLKLHDRNPAYTQMVDKYAVREYVKKTIGEEYLIPLLGVWEKAEDINLDELPNQFVLKCTHDSGSVIICKDKKTFDFEKVKRNLTLSLKLKHYNIGREWVYKDVIPRIIAEEYMVDESGYELKDYKFFTFDGEVKALYVATDRQSGDTKFDFFDKEFTHLPLTNTHPNSTKTIKRPEGFEEMIKLAEKLSKGIPHVRADFYDINGHIYFGELTFYHMGAVTPFEPEEWEYTFGSWIQLPQKTE